MHSLKRFALCSAACVLIAGWAAAQADFPAVFVANNVSDEISVLRVESDGSLTFLANYPASDGPQTISLSPDGSLLGVGHGTQNEVFEAFRIYDVNSDGSLTALTTVNVPDSPLDCQWVSNEVIAIIETSVGGDNFVRMYRFDGKFNTLTEIDSESTGSFNAYLAFDPNNDLLFAQSSLGAPYHVFSFAVNPDGTIDPRADYIPSGVFPLELAISNSGEWLYAGCGISGDEHRVLGFDVASDGNLMEIPGSPFFSPGDSPANLAITDDDAFIFVGHGADATVHSLAIHAETGALTPTGFSFDVGLQGTIGDVQTMGDLLFITDESTATDGIKGVYSFRINPDGSFTQIGSIVDPGTSRPEAMAVWRGPAAGEPAILSGFDFAFGSYLSGVLGDLDDSDDSYLTGQSQFGFSAQEANLIELRVTAMTAVPTPASIDVTAEARLNNPGGTARLRLMNHATGVFDEIDVFPIGQSDVSRTIEDLDGSIYVRQTDGQLELAFRASVVATFSAKGFQGLFDQTRFLVE